MCLLILHELSMVYTSSNNVETQGDYKRTWMFARGSCEHMFEPNTLAHTIPYRNFHYLNHDS